eukprot:CAMPEP_0114630064 /NCGR_PEP_ID=MMETSP0168-20121206/13689_1 /TAXON_ID=95228 ORGANISM="Vannella sp., Strain DIVA3 517/6/12" /NCGR_SAMPLE_ID=MMETSP0168 /ASSEMBLY_ACC=CAM_ASM_000044 /LENGTH=655 /DNA_ID=CAMNT_0001841557 /DNA_START=1 /DNA_END=1965 /DNA_ORIENTATION=+
MSGAAGAVMLAEKWDVEKTDPKGWWMSEKLDGVRAKWTGKNFYSRNGGRFYAPKWFKAQMPNVPLDGELWGGRRQFQRTVGIVKTHIPVDDDWKYLSYMVFDAPDQKGGFEERMKFAKKILKGCATAQAVGMCKCKGKEHLYEKLEEVEAGGGEGLMLRAPKSQYEGRRSSNLLKVKTFFDEECIVVGHKPGTGRNHNRMGALFVQTPDGREFKVGTGFNDAQRNNPPKKGTVITYRYQELSNSGHPRFPSFIGERIDIDWAAYCKTYTPPEKNKPGPLKRKHTILFDEAPSREEEEEEAASGETDVVKNVQRRLAKASQSFIADEMDSDVEEEPSGEKPACRFGAACFRVNPAHLASYSHPPKKPATADEATKTVGKKRARDGEGDASEAAPAAAKKARKEEEEESANDIIDDDEAAGGDILAAPVSPSRRRVAPNSDKIPCKWGSKCFDQSKAHLRRFSHPSTPVMKDAAKEEKEDKEEAKTTPLEVPAELASAMEVDGEEEDEEVADVKQEVRQIVTRFFLVENCPPSSSAQEEDNEDEDREMTIENEVELLLDQDLTLGRGTHSFLSDSRLSRRQLRVIARSVPTPSFATSIDAMACIEVEPLGLNYCLLRKSGAATFSTKLTKGHLYHVRNGDQIALLPDQSISVTVQFR